MSYQLPTGGYTARKKEYLAAWLKLSKKVQELTGYSPRGFDPSLSFSDPQTGESVQIPVGFALAIAQLEKPESK